jgi:FlaA1/EpsC-like NDP-sugar epimerase
MHFISEKILKNRRVIFSVADAIIIIISFYLAFVLRFDAKIPEEYLDGTLQEMIIISLVFCLPIFNSFGLYAFSWSYVSTEEFLALFKAAGISFMLTGFSLLVFRELNAISTFPRSTVILAYVLIFVLSGGIRIAKRMSKQLFKGKIGGAKTLIVGAGDAGEQILRSIKASKDRHYLPTGFIDDNDSKRGITIHGLPVLGKIDDIPEIVEKEKIEELIIALPSAGNEPIKKAVELGRKAGLKKIKIVPPISEIVSGEISLGNLREVSIEDLLGREPVKIDTDSIEKFIKGKNILITGAAGSIGAELSRQISKFDPSLLILLDQDETGIFNISKEIGSRFSSIRIRPIICDIRDREKIERIFELLKPDIVFHAAAYKHVPLMEEQYDEAVKNNVFGTEIVVKASLKSGVSKFVFVSTDKAVNPTSIMGATKRLGEIICQNLNRRNETKFVSVRFGNVLGSRGSVIPIFSEMIKKREAIEITHPDMERYFMMIPEACLLVMQASEMGNGGEVFVLDMGKPVKILDMAKEMIKLSGLEPDKDIPIVFSGARPGEKMYEEILTAEEGTIATKNQKIFIARFSNIDEVFLNEKLTVLRKISENNSKKEEITAILKELIPSYKPNNN